MVRDRFAATLLFLLVLSLSSCSSRFREPIQLTSGKTVDVVGLQVQVIKRSDEPVSETVYHITYATVLPLIHETVRPEAVEVWEHFEPTLNPNINHVIVHAIHEPVTTNPTASMDFECFKTNNIWSAQN